MTFEFSDSETFGVHKWAIDIESVDENAVLYSHITGGPWKWIRNRRTGAVLHRIGKTEIRLDLIVIIRSLGVMLFCEAKKTLDDLYDDDTELTLTKHVKIINRLTNQPLSTGQTLGTEQEGWSEAEAASIVLPTLLWRAEEDNRPTSKQVEALFDEFREKLEAGDYVGPMVLVGLEVITDSEMTLSTSNYVYSDEGSANLVKPLKDFLSGL